jgi:hypothetical protein
MMMHRFTGFLLLAALAAFAQDNKSLFNTAPPEVEKALRERVAGFYQCYVDGKYRQAEQYVAEDTKDLHYQQEKNKIRGFEIIKVVFDDSFKKARVVTTIGTTVTMRGNHMPVAAPMATHWKIEDGKWMYYVDAKHGVETPVGIMRGGPGTPKPGAPFGEMIKNPQAILSQLKVSKPGILLKGHENSTDSLTVTNNMPGAVTVGFEGEKIPGLSWSFDKTEIPQGQTAVLKFTYAPPDQRAKPSLQGALSIEPFGQRLAIRIDFDIPDDVKEQLQKKQKKK